MSNQILFDKLVYIDRLKNAGLSEEQARAHAEAMHEALRESVATKRDLSELEQRLTIRFGGMLIVAVGVLLAAKFFG